MAAWAWASGVASVALVSMVSLGCETPAPEAQLEGELRDAATREPGDGVDPAARAEELAKRLLILDGHVDLPERLVVWPEDIGQRTEHGELDIPRARAGGLDAPFMSIFVPASFQETGGARRKADELIDLVERLVSEQPDELALARSVAELRRNFERGLVSLPMGMENGAGLEGDLANVRHFRDRGIRYITLVHGKANAICDSSYDATRPWHGLSPFGRQVVAEMNRLGIMIDVSHVSDEAFHQVLELSSVPVIASHSSCRHFTPGWERNMSDDMIRQLAAKGGVVQINFGEMFLDDAYRLRSEARRQRATELLEEQGIDEGSEQAYAFFRRYRKEHPIERVPLARVVDHIDRVVDLGGIDHVGLGSDFDGVGGALPDGLEDVSKYPNLIRALLERGYSEADIEKICSGNALRVWSAVERAAEDAG